ncbi:MAG: hypothetical protein IJ604_08785 [Prevotella sp.]|nr:hypothetical protein [Prevotella sp.]
MMHTIYMGEFVSRGDDTLWTVSIQQDLASAPSVIGKLEFPGREPLLIEWDETSKEDVICGSTATLKIISPGDRTYAGLYTIKAGTIGIRIEREGRLYWMGTLDPEFYEEPYTDNEDYEVELTFSDFGIFERLQYTLSGMQTLEAIVKGALVRAQIGEELDQGWISTRLEGTKMTLGSLSVRSDNFIDEDGEVSNLKDVIEGILQPLGLRLIQRNGKVWVYDLNGIYQGAGTEKIRWHDKDQMMGVDKVANNVRISLSPYASSELINGEIEFGGEYSVETTNLVASPGANCYSYYPDYSDEHRQGSNWDYNLINFTIFLCNSGKGLAYVNSSARWFHILPVVSGPSECDGIAWGFYSGGHGSIDEYHHWPKKILNTIGKISSTEVMRTNRVFLPKLSSDDMKKYRVRLSLEMLMDARYNPFSDANDGNEKGNYNSVKVWTGWAFVPVAVTVYDEKGMALCHYDNSVTAKGEAKGHLGYANGEWKAGAGNFGDAFLEYYDPTDLSESAGIQGWKANRHCIGRPRNAVIYDSFKQMADGEYMPYPPNGGYIEVKVFAGVNCYDYDESTGFDTTSQWDKKSLYSKIRWLLYKAPKVELVRNNLAFESEELEDVEYKGYINKDAKEEISLDTICGTVSRPAPTAKGLYYRSSDGLQIKQLTRQGRTNLVEKLLIGTLYSQFADRHTKLTGTAFLMKDALRLYTDGMQGARKFLMLADLQDLDAGTSEATVVELSPDEYDAIEYDGD